MTTIATAIVSEYALVALIERVNKLNRRATRHGMEPIGLQSVDAEPVETEAGDLSPRFEVTITGSAPRIEGWVLAAKVERDEVIGILVSVIPGPFDGEDYSEYRGHNFFCDHCNSQRGRNAVFVLRNGDETKVVGRNCLADFLRNEDAEAFARFAELVDAIQHWEEADLDREGRESFGRGGEAPTALDRFLATVQCCTRRLGWLSRTAARESFDEVTPTADVALFVLHGDGRLHRELIQREELYINDGDREIAQAAIAWAAGLTDLRNEYVRTIHEIAKAGQVTRRLAGYAASIVRAYQRDQEREQERAEQRKTAKTKVYAGEPCKTRDIGIATIKRVRYVDGFYGTKTIVALDLPVSDTEVAPLVWFASGSLEFEEGASVHVRAGIKECKDDERFGKQTVLTRAKLSEVS